MAWTENLQVAAVGAAFAVAGYVGKSVVDWWQEKRKKRSGTIAELQNLESLLKASDALFKLQQEQAKNLTAMLKKNHPKEFDGNEGYDDAMTRCYSVMNSQERELHGIIRAYTEHSLRKVNQAMSDWCSADKAFKTGIMPSTRKRELAEELFALEIHLMLWHAKYESWIPNCLEHAMVYLDDEKKHGLGFPKRRFVRNPRKSDEAVENLGVDEEVARALEELQQK